MERVAGLAQALMHRLATANQQAILMQPPGLTARTPAKPLALGVVRGAQWHILCAVGDWNVIVTPPPALARFARRWEWHEHAPVDALAESLAALADEWWLAMPDAVGTFDVAGAITHATTSALGALGTIVYSDPGKHGSEVTARIGVGRDRRDPLWPYLVDVYAEQSSILVRTTGRNFEITDIHQLARDLPAIVEHLRRCDEACDQWLAQLAAVRAAASSWIAANPPPVEHSEWTEWPTTEVKPEEVPTIWLVAKAYQAERFTVRVAMSADGPIMHIGNDALPLVPGNADAITKAIEREAREARDPEMSDYERYR